MVTARAGVDRGRSHRLTQSQIGHARRPLFVGRLPARLEELLYYRFFKPLPEKYGRLFDSAPLRFSPGVSATVPRSRDFMYECIAFLGFYERELSKRTRYLARRGGFMVDIGANVGYFSLIWLGGNEKNCCLCLEPSPLVTPYLETNIKRNGFVPRTRIIPAAAGASSSVLPFDLRCEEPTGWAHFASEAGNRTTVVSVVRVEDVVNETQVIDFMKVDVEGAEAWVLQGCGRLLTEGRIRNVYLEQNKPGARRLGIDEDLALSLLRTAGYRLISLDSGRAPEIANWWATVW